MRLPDRAIKGLIITGFAAGATATGGALFAAEGVAVLTAYLNTKHGEQLIREIGKGERKEAEAAIAASPKVKRKASAYAKRYGAIYKRLKKKHPRMSFGALSKKAHKEARRKKR